MKYLILLYIANYVVHSGVSKSLHISYNHNETINRNELHENNSNKINERIGIATDNEMDVKSKKDQSKAEYEKKVEGVKIEMNSHKTNSYKKKEIKEVKKRVRHNKQYRNTYRSAFSGSCLYNKERADDGTCLSIEVTDDSPVATTGHQMDIFTTSVTSQPINLAEFITAKSEHSYNEKDYQ